MTRLIFPLLLAATLPTYAADLTIDVAGVSGADGRIMVAVCDSAEAFPAKPLRSMAVPAQDGPVQVRVTGLPAEGASTSVNLR